MYSENTLTGHQKQGDGRLPLLGADQQLGVPKVPPMTRDTGRGTMRKGTNIFFAFDKTLLLILHAKGRNGCLGTNKEVRL